MTARPSADPSVAPREAPTDAVLAEMRARDVAVPGARSGWSQAEKDRHILLDALAAAREASPDDLRALGWSVAVHNDYRQSGAPHTFWLLTKGGRCIKGEGRTDAEALANARTHLPQARAAEEG